MTDQRHEALHEVVKRLPSDFAPWGERSRDDDWGPDCSSGCRWFVRLEPGLQYDWGVCHNPKSPRCGLLTFEHQGCREFEEDDDLVLGAEVEPGQGQTKRSDEIVLIANLRRRGKELAALLEASSDHWGFEDPVYRFYHQSFKVYWLQERTKAICAELARLSPPGRRFNSWFVQMVNEGTGREFRVEDNQDWLRVTRPMLEAFFHARFFLEMAVRYGGLEAPPNPLPSGYAALLYLYGLREGERVPSLALSNRRG